MWFLGRRAFRDANVRSRNEDAERDCTTTLKLDAKNVKAWFRRGQARAGMGRIAAALDGESSVTCLGALGDGLSRF